MEAARAALASLCAEGGIRFLEDAFLDLAVPGSSPPVRIFGATLWTDHCLDGRANLANARSTARKSMNDYASIRLAGRKLTPQTTEAFHRASLEALKHARATLPPDHAFVVVTHHGPHPASIHPRYAGTNVNPCFASDLSDLIRELRPALWVHGHTHASRDVVVEGCTHLVCNPRGYPLRKSGRYENEAFELDKVVVVGKTWS
jgi:Icc-related predicted phosphoesterase